MWLSTRTGSVYLGGSEPFIFFLPQAECRQASELVAGLHNLFLREDQQISGEAAACSEVTQGLSVALMTGYLSIFLSVFTAVHRGRFQ